MVYQCFQDCKIGPPPPPPVLTKLFRYHSATDAYNSKTNCIILYTNLKQINQDLDQMMAVLHLKASLDEKNPWKKTKIV
jgi:hypothetical protein